LKRHLDELNKELPSGNKLIRASDLPEDDPVRVDLVGKIASWIASKKKFQLEQQSASGDNAAHAGGQALTTQEQAMMVDQEPSNDPRRSTLKDRKGTKTTGLDSRTVRGLPPGALSMFIPESMDVDLGPKDYKRALMADPELRKRKSEDRSPETLELLSTGQRSKKKAAKQESRKSRRDSPGYDRMDEKA